MISYKFMVIFSRFGLTFPSLQSIDLNLFYDQEYFRSAINVC